jgi:hypothetical protein
MTIRVAAAVVAALCLAGCGSGSDDRADRSGEGKREGGGAPTELEVSVRPEGPRGPSKLTRISCDAVGKGASGARCRGLEGLERADLAAVPARRACTQVYGGPATATVSGTLRGEPVSARFNLRDGCEIARWRRNAELLGPPVGAPPAPPQ